MQLERLPLTEIEKILTEKPLNTPLTINKCEKVVDADRFIKTGLKVLKSNPANKRFLPYYERLNFIANQVKNKMI